ncbi:MAG: hypothetical protein K8S25_14430 [Alphaproteobacteria bacterium]|nr:hypothetical protein [Alphaproteobacteria bacterium]
MTDVNILQGFDTFSGSGKNTVVVGTLGKPVSHLVTQIKVCTSSAEVSEAIEVDASVAVSYGAFSGGAKSKYLHNLDLTTFSVAIVMYASRQQSVARDTVSIPPDIIKGLTDEAAVRSFVLANGDSWVREVTKGSEYIGTFVFKSRTFSEQTAVEAAINAAFSAGATIDSSLSTKLKTALKTSNVEYEIRNFVAGTTKAGPLPGNSVNDIEKMVEYALNFVGAEADQPTTVSFAVEPYERLLGSGVNFSLVTKNRRSFLGNPAHIGWGEMAIRLQQVLNAGREIQGLYRFYGWGDTAFSQRISQVTNDLGDLYDFLSDVDADPVAAYKFTPPESSTAGFPEPDFIVRVPVRKDFLNGGGGGHFQDVSAAQIGQLVRLTSIDIQRGANIDMVIANYSTKFPSEKFFCNHGTPGGGGVGIWELQDGEWITSMHGYMNSYWGSIIVGGLHFQTNKGHSWYTAKDDDALYTQRWEVGPNQVFIGFAGQSGNNVDGLQPLVVEFLPTKWSQVRAAAQYVQRDFAPVRIQNVNGEPAYDQTVAHGTTGYGPPLTAVSCGPFAAPRPVKGRKYKVTVTENGNQHQPIYMYCTFSGGTSQFNINPQSK